MSDIMGDGRNFSRGGGIAWTDRMAPFCGTLKKRTKTFAISFDVLISI